MRIKLDENLPTSLVEALVQLGHDADSVQQEGLQGSPDAGVWAAAQADKRFLVTQDLDFSDLRQFAPGTHYGLLLVRLADPGRRVLKAYIECLFRTEDVERWAGCFVVATDGDGGGTACSPRRRRTENLMERRTLEQLEAALDAVSKDLAPRVEELAQKSTEGALTPEEQREYAEIVRLNDRLSLLKLEAEEFWTMRAAS